MPEVNDEQTPRPTPCGRCGQPKPDDGADWCRQCENDNAAEALAALRDDRAGWVSGSGGTEDDVVELCPQAKVPCEPNLFDMCRYCGRDLSGNPDA